MWSQYDENLGDNPFFKEVKKAHGDITERASKENWIICVPRLGSIEPNNIIIEAILDHILVPATDGYYSTLSKKQVNVINKHINVGSSQLFTNNIEILFEETFYVNKHAKYTVWCIDRPLFLKYNYSDSRHDAVLENLHDCIDFLWTESLSHGILDNLRQTVFDFVRENGGFEGESLQTQKELVGNLYSQCLQAALKIEVMRDKYLKSLPFLENLKISVEAYMQYCLGRKLIFSVNSLQYQTDSCINKIIRNSSDLTFHALGISDIFSDVIMLAKCELNKINNYVTVLDKMSCLKKTLNIIYETVKDVYVTSDEVLQILAFLIAKLNVNNWAGNLTYIKEFGFSLLDKSNQNNFIITSLEATVEFIKSNEFLEIRNCSVRSTVLDSCQLCIQTIFDEIKSGNVNTLDSLTKEDSSFEPKLCHPLCMCDKCKYISENYKDIPNYSNEKGQNLLIIASILGDCDVVEFLLENNVDVNVSDYWGCTPLHYAASRGYQDILLLLVNSGANVNAIDNEKNSPLHLACNYGHENSAKGLIYSSPEVELNVSNFFGDTALHLATKWGYLEIVKILLENGASVIIENKRHQTVVNLAPNYYIFKLIEDFGVKKSTMISKSIHKVDSVSIEKDLIVDDCKEHGFRPKNLEQYKKIDLLLKAIQSNDLPLTCFYLGFSCSSSKVVDRETCHPLCVYENCQNEQEFDYDLPNTSTQTININTCDDDGYTPLHVAAKFGRTDILRLLLDCGALPNVQTYKSLYVPLHLACTYQRIPIVKELVNCGDCKIDAQDSKGNTPLFYACAKNDVKIVEILLSNGADCNKRNYSGRSALQESEENMQYRVFKLLKNSTISYLEKGEQDMVLKDKKLF
ncbi:hypothetical protein NQ317_018843 [Molorchus minor]|uniref:VPS9 domain-containing protein n=1 Tax=Molorchus minor TaxID=1323400 RepID=A0ABQ9J5H2_9CUCU|nr:hypothetical protein NQ317_018843 [Molorchus minor]